MGEMIVLVVVLLGSGRAANSIQQKQTMSRDLRLYDQPAPYTLPVSLRDGQRKKVEAEIRGFLWTHWHQHRLGKLVATWYSKEGEPTTYTYFVEPDEKGVWQIKGQWESHRGHRGAPSAPKAGYHVSGEFVASSVERIVPLFDGLSPRIVQDGRPPESYVLVLKDRDGKDVNII
ncbi:MAG TPA: hypothetical protein VG204_19790 [Terriglobia bacterium]|nr:hypothetical protein [Terriglobia bacterium]